MKVLVKELDLDNTLNIAKSLTGEYKHPVVFHAFWNGNFIEKHFLSIKSCFLTNIKNNINRKIVIWIENNIPNEWNYAIEQYAEIRIFNLENEKIDTPLYNKNFYYNRTLSFYSDVVRYILLYKYAGCWFDLDIFFLRNFDPLFSTFSNDIMVYQWESQNYPNGAIFISLHPKDPKMKTIIDYIIEKNKGWGFQEANITYNLPLELLVLPCSWFDAGWLPTPKITVDQFFLETSSHVSLSSFYEGAFCFHWHNRWSNNIHKDSPCYKLIELLDHQ